MKKIIPCFCIFFIIISCKDVKENSPEINSNLDKTTVTHKINGLWQFENSNGFIAFQPADGNGEGIYLQIDKTSNENGWKKSTFKYSVKNSFDNGNTVTIYKYVGDLKLDKPIILEVIRDKLIYKVYNPFSKENDPPISLICNKVAEYNNMSKYFLDEMGIQFN